MPESILREIAFGNCRLCVRNAETVDKIPEMVVGTNSTRIIGVDESKTRQHRPLTEALPKCPALWAGIFTLPRVEEEWPADELAGT